MSKVSEKPVFKEGPFGYAFKNGKFYAFDKRSVLVLKAWPDPRSWLKRRSHDWKSNRMHADRFLSSALFAAGEEAVLPKRPLRLHPEHELVGTSEAWLEEQALFWEREHALEIHNRRRMAAYFDLIPPEIRSELLRYRDRRWHLLNLFARCPGALDLSRSNPALAYALASNWVFHKPAVTRPLRAARGLVNRKQREIMKWLRFPPREPVRRILTRIPAESLSIGNLLCLRRALRRKSVVKALAHVRRINAAVIRVTAEVEGEELLTPRLLNEIGQDRTQDALYPSVLTTFRDTVRMLRVVSRPDKPPAPFFSLCRLQTIHEQCAREFQNDPAGLTGLGSIPKTFPEAPFAGNETIMPIHTPGELHAEGREMHNCVFSYIHRIADGSEYIYRVLAPVRATFSVLKRDNVWVAGQLAEVCNKDVPENIREQVWKALCATPRGPTATADEQQTDPAAQTRLGWMYLGGQGVSKDADKGLQWMLRAGRQGYAPAQNALGWFFAHGMGVPQDDVEAVGWFRKAAVQGDMLAQNNLGWMIEHGRGGSRDDREAASWYARSAAKGHVRGELHYGLMLRDGRGKRKSPAVAAKWISKAAERGDAESQWEWAQMLAGGQGVRKNRAAALQWYEKAAAKGYALAKEKLRELGVSNPGRSFARPRC